MNPISVLTTLRKYIGYEYSVAKEGVNFYSGNARLLPTPGIVLSSLVFGSFF